MKTSNLYNQINSHAKVLDFFLHYDVKCNDCMFLNEYLAFLARNAFTPTEEIPVKTNLSPLYVIDNYSLEDYMWFFCYPEILKKYITKDLIKKTLRENNPNCISR